MAKEPMKTNKKWCFVAKEVKGGWRLKLAYGSKDYPVRGVVFKKMEEIELKYQYLKTKRKLYGN